MNIALLRDTTAAAPEPSLTPPQQALWWLLKGGFATGPAWQKAHALCQTDEGNPRYDLVHALAHWIEGDEPNARYWYARVKGPRAATIEAEWNRIAAVLTAPD